MTALMLIMSRRCLAEVLPAAAKPPVQTTSHQKHVSLATVWAVTQILECVASVADSC